MDKPVTISYSGHGGIHPAYKTPLGRMYCGLSEDLLSSRSLGRLKGRIQLVFTSPPFALNRKKRYGNLQGQEYIDWIASYAPILREFVPDDGSIVIELGNGWEPGQPTMSTLAMEALLAFKKKADLYLCQEFICFNPARLPSPAQWVTVERTRVKDAFTRVWWMSPSANPRADNRQVLTEYSPSMKLLLKRGTYNSGKRPSEHHIGTKSFLKKHQGAIPPNVLVSPAVDTSEQLFDLFVGTTNLLPIANTRSWDPYQEYCRQHDLIGHPARMPARLVEFFILFLTSTRDLVLDPFAGSNTTGAIAERLGRRWVSIECQREYAEASRARFEDIREE